MFYLMTAFCAAQGATFSSACVSGKMSHLIHFFISTQEILHAPENTTVYQGQSAVFTCETDGGLAGWKINDSLIGDLPAEILLHLSVTSTDTANGTIVGELTIPARVEYNGTRVQCVVLTFGGSPAESETVTLKMQGIIALLTFSTHVVLQYLLSL